MLVSNLEVSGSIKMHGGGITGSLSGTASYTLTSSIALTASYIIGSTATASLAETASYAFTASYVDFPTGSISNANLTGSLTISGTLDVTGSTSLSGSLEVLEYIKSPEISASFISASTIRATSYTGSFTGSAKLSGLFSGSFTGSANLSGSFTGSYTGSFVGAARLSGSYTGSFTGSAKGTFTGSFSGSGANIYDISASSIIGLNLARISSGSVTASVSPVEGFVVKSIKSTVSGSLTVTGTVSGSFSGSGADLYDISASSIIGLKLNDMSTGSVTASVDAELGFAVTSVDSGSLFKGDVKIETGSLTAEYIYAGYPSGSGVSGSTLVSGTNMFGTASWATNIAGNKYINTGSTNASQAISGSLVITQNLTVQGSSSFTYVTASQILIDQNTLTVFTTGSTLPNGGYKVADTSSWDGTSSFTNESSLLYNTVDKYWSFANSLIVSGNLEVSGAITASNFEGTASLASTASYVNPLTQSVVITGSLEVDGKTIITGSILVNSPLIISQSYSSSISQSISASVTESITLWATNSFTFPNTGSNIFGTASWAQNAVSAAWAPGTDASATASYAIEAAGQRYVTESQYYAIHPSHVSTLSEVYNHGTYSLNEGKGVYAVGTRSLYDHGRLEVGTFYNKGIFINSGDLDLVAVGAAGGGGTAETASYAIRAITASYSLTASHLLPNATSSYAITASYVEPNATASYSITASYALSSSFVLDTASLITTGSQDDIQNLNGRLQITGSFVVTGSALDGDAIYKNETRFNYPTTPFRVLHTAFASSSVGRSTNRTFDLNCNTADGFTISNQSYNYSRSAFINVGDELVYMRCTSASRFTQVVSYANSVVVEGTKGPGQDPETFIKTRTWISGSGNAYALLLENAASLDGERVDYTSEQNPQKDVVRIWGQRVEKSGSIQFGARGTTNLGFYVTQSSGVSFGNNVDSLCYDSLGGHVFKLGANTLFSVDGQAIRAGLHANFAVSEVNYQTTFRHVGSGRNLMLKQSTSNGTFNHFEISAQYVAGTTNRIIIMDPNGNGVSLNKGSTSWSTFSDERVKDIVEPITNAVTKIEGLRTVIGKYKTDEEGVRRSFFIAQDVVEQFPEAADTSNPDQLGVQYTELSPLLAAAIKELAQESRDLKEENTQIKAELAEIKLLLSQLSK